MKRATNSVAGLVKMVCGVPTCSIRPLFITTIRSASAMASSWLWVTCTKEMPSSFCSRFKLGAHLDAQEGIERRQRLVEQEDLRLRNERPGQRHALLLATRQLRRQPRGVVVHGDQTQHLVRLGVAGRLVDALHLQAEGDVVEGGQVRKQRVALEHHGRAALGRRLAGDVGRRRG